MRNFVLEKYDDEGKMCTFYTVRWESEEISETDKFFLRFENDPIYEDTIRVLVILIFSVIGNSDGAKKDYFRFENEAHALPPKPGNPRIERLELNFSDFPIRLFCLRLSESVVILFNGGIKTSRSAQDGDTSMVFHEANQFAKRITSAIGRKEIYLNNERRTITSSYDSEQIII